VDDAAQLSNESYVQDASLDWLSSIFKRGWNRRRAGSNVMLSAFAARGTRYFGWRYILLGLRNQYPDPGLHPGGCDHAPREV